MSTTATATPAPSTPPVAITTGNPPPQVTVGSSDEMDADGFTAAEREYFDSRGAKTDGLAKATAQPAAAPAASAAPAVTGDDDDAVDGEVSIDDQGRVKDVKTGRFVPHKAHHQLRERFKATRAELEQTKEKYARIDERITTLNQLLTGQPAATGAAPAAAPAVDEAAPDPEADLFGYVKWQAKQIERLNAELTKSKTTTEEYIGTQTHREAYTRDAAQFVTKQPDFLEALKNLRAGRAAELEAIGMDDAAQRAQQIAREERDIVQAAISKKKSPSEMLYAIAKARGYAPPAPKPNPTPATTPAQSTIDHAAQIEQIANGQKQAASGFASGGGIVGEGLTAEALANMSDDEYAATVSRMTAAQRKAVFGG